MSVQHGSERPGPRRRSAVPTDDAARRVESAAFLDSGRRLPQAVMSRFGGLLGYDLGTVRLHDNRASRGRSVRRVPERRRWERTSRLVVRRSRQATRSHHVCSRTNSPTLCNMPAAPAVRA